MRGSPADVVEGSEVLDASCARAETLTNRKARATAHAVRGCVMCGARALELAYAAIIQQTPCRDEAQQDAVEDEHGRGGCQCRHPAGDEAAERHTPAEREHVD